MSGVPPTSPVVSESADTLPKAIQQTNPARKEMPTLIAQIRSNEYVNYAINQSMRPMVYIVISVVAYCIYFGKIYIDSGVDLNAIDTSNINTWWVGTLLSSAIFLLVYYAVFRSGQYYNKSLLFLVLLTFLILNISLVLTQINLTV
jgi:hypothetical protein